MTSEQVKDSCLRTVAAGLEMSAILAPSHMRNAIIGTLVVWAKQLPAGYWEAMRIVKPCATVGCECHVATRNFMESLEEMKSEVEEQKTGAE